MEYKLKQMKKGGYYIITENFGSKKIIVKCIVVTDSGYQVITYDDEIIDLQLNVAFEDIFLIQPPHILENIIPCLQEYGYNLKSCLIYDNGKYNGIYFENAIYAGGGFCLVKNDETEKFDKEYSVKHKQFINKEILGIDFFKELNAFFDVNRLFSMVRDENIPIRGNQKDEIVFNKK